MNGYCEIGAEQEKFFEGSVLLNSSTDRDSQDVSRFVDVTADGCMTGVVSQCLREQYSTR